MSYILDALKKSEQEHKKGQVPGLGTVQGLPGPGGRFETDRLIWMYSLATILLATLAIGTWLYLRKPAPQPEPPPPSANLQLPTEEKATAAAPAKPLPQTKAEAKPAATLPATKTAPPLPAQPPPTGSGNTESPKAATPEAIAQFAPTVILSPVAPARVIENSQPPPVRVEETAPAQPATEENRPEKAEIPLKPELMPVVPMEELPAALRAEMPEVKIGVHLFSETPASRRASINGRLLHEGQQVEKDLVLVEVIRQGVLLSFKGRRFTMPVFPR